MVTKILLGPVLSFRGSSKGKWKVSALIGIGELDKAPKLVVEIVYRPDESVKKTVNFTKEG